MSSVHPRIIDQNATLRALQPVATGDGQYDEDWLQKLLFNHPDLLPIADIEPEFGRLIPLAREFPVSSGCIDVLYASANGSLCLVETKLWRNPEAHRIVLTQLLGYAEALSRVTLTEFKAEVQAEARRRGQPDALDEILKRARTEEGDFGAIDFETNLRQSLATGAFLLLIVADRIRPGAVLLSDFLGAKPSLEFSLKLVEMNFYHLNGNEEWPVLAVPSVVGRSREVTRAVVRIRYEEKQPEVEVVAADDASPVAPRTNLEVFLKSLPSGLDNIFRAYLEGWMSGPFTVYWGKSGFSLRVAVKGKLVTIIDAQPTYISVIMDKYLPQMGDPAETYRLYRDTVRDIPAVQQVFAKNGRYVYDNQMTLEQAQTLLEATDRFVRALAEGSKQ